MRCSPRSTTWRVNAAGLAVAAVLLGGPRVGVAAEAQGTVEVVVTRAVERAVQTAMGGDVEVTVSELRIVGVVDPGRRVEAVPDPGARANGPVRFALRIEGADGRLARVGRAEAHVAVHASHPRAAREIARGRVITEDDIEMVTGPIGHVPLKPLVPVRPGVRALRTIRTGDMLRARHFTGVALVRAGDEVVTRVSNDGLVVTGRAIAAQSGYLGRTIDVVNPDSGKRLRGRVVGEREVEVFHES